MKLSLLCPLYVLLTFWFIFVGELLYDYKFGTSSRGHPILLHNGYEYQFEANLNHLGRRYLRCSRYRNANPVLVCRARAVLLASGGLQVKKFHNH